MPIWGWVCTGLVVLAVVLLVFSVIADRRQWKYYQEHGERVVGWIVQANTSLYSSGGLDKPAQILVAFDGGDEPDPALADLATVVAELKGTDPEDDVEAEVARLVNDESYRPFERFRLPLAFTGGREVYSMHIWVKRSLLPGGVLRHPFVRCLVLRDDPKSRPLMDSYRESDEKHQR
jgi:hypothetical protein